MLRFSFLILLSGAAAMLSASKVRAAGLTPSSSRFYYEDAASGRIHSARIIHHYWKVPIVHPMAHVDPRLDPKLRRAATIADERANAHSKARCWRYVKEALVASGAISSYPKTNYAWQAGEELERDFGFKRLAVRDPYAAPLGAVLVYDRGGNAPGHVEIRTKTGFVSDYRTKNRCKYRLLAAYAKYGS